MPLVDTDLVHGHQQDLLRAAASTRRPARPSRRRQRAALIARAARASSRTALPTAAPATPGPVWVLDGRLARR